MADTKYPACACEPKRYTYYRRRNRNSTLHLIRKCRVCHKAAQNAMRKADYPAEWVNTLDIIETQGTGQNGAIVQNANPTQSRADAIMHKLQSHIANRSKQKTNVVY